MCLLLLPLVLAIISFVKLPLILVPLLAIHLSSFKFKGVGNYILQYVPRAWLKHIVMTGHREGQVMTILSRYRDEGGGEANVLCLVRRINFIIIIVDTTLKLEVRRRGLNVQWVKCGHWRPTGRQTNRCSHWPQPDLNYTSSALKLFDLIPPATHTQSVPDLNYSQFSCAVHLSLLVHSIMACRFDLWNSLETQFGYWFRKNCCCYISA